MATTENYIAFVMDTLPKIPGITFRSKKMFGEYCVYANEKPILLICDNTVHVKILPCLETLMTDAPSRTPYEGAKIHYLLNIEDSRLTEKVIVALEQNTPLPKARKKKS